MSTDLVRLHVPTTGELVELDSSTDVLADQFDRIAELEQQLRDVRKEIAAEVLSRMDKELARSHRAGDFFLECEAPNQRDYDPDELAEVLASLVAEDKISEDAMSQALKRDVSYKPMKRAIDKLVASPNLTDDDRAAVEACAHPRTRARRLTIKRHTGASA